MAGRRFPHGRGGAVPVRREPGRAVPGGAQRGPGVAIGVLAADGADLRDRPYTVRRAQLVGLLDPPGSFLWAPRDVAHAFCVESDRAKFLALSTPGGFDRFFFATGEPAATLTLPPPAKGSSDIEGLIRAMNEYGVEMVGPPPTPRHVP